MSLTTLQQKPGFKQVVLVEQKYPYGKSSVYMPTALVVVAAQLVAAGHQVKIVDFNLDTPDDPTVQALFSSADVIGVSVIGAPYMPQTIAFCRRLAVQHPTVRVIVGGQIISKLTPVQFARLFAWTNALRIASPEDLVPLFGPVLSAYAVPLVPVYEQMGSRLNEYLQTEFPLWVSQGCFYNCSKFCSAPRNQLEQHHNLARFKEGIDYMVKRAVECKLDSLRCYASSLDFFQNPKTVAEYLKAIAEVREKYNFVFRIRALSCLTTFLKAARVLPDFRGLLERGGFWRVGFGVDGSGESEWKKQNKIQNHTRDVGDSLEMCEKLGLEAEVIMITGYPNSTLPELFKTVYNSFGYLLRWRNVRLRAYLAKMVLPGNDGWESDWKTVEALLENPQLFYNLEFNALGSSLTHPKVVKRWLGNLSFLLLTLGVAAFGRSISFPLLPQGQKGLYGKFAKFVNSRMPIVD